MAVRATETTASQAYMNVKAQARNLRSFCLQASQNFAGQGAETSTLYQTMQRLIQAKANIDENKSTPGIVDAAKREEDDPSYDVVAEYATLDTLIVQAASRIINDFPRDSDGWLLSTKLTAQGEFEERYFTAQSLTNVTADLAAIVAQIT